MAIYEEGEMIPGRELDVLIAEKVLGKQLKLFSTGQLLEDFGYTGEPIKPYSTSIEAAWEVVKAMNAKGFRFAIETDNEPYVIAIFGTGNYIGDALSGPGAVSGDTAPHAICLAALEAVGVSVD